MQDGRQKGEVQLAFTFQPFDQSVSSSSQDHQANLDIVQAQHSPSSTAGSARATPDNKHADTPDPGVVPELTADGLGPLGHSFMNLAMTHITSRKPDLAASLGDHRYLKLPPEVEGIEGTAQSPRAVPSAPAQSLAAISGSPPIPSAPSQKRNFYPEEASDDEEVQAPCVHQHGLSAASVAVMPIEFICQPPPDTDSMSGATCNEDNESYSCQEVYHAYSTRESDGSQPGVHPLQIGAYSAQGQVQGQGNEQQPQVPQWQLMGTSPLREGYQQGQYDRQECQQAQGQGQGRKQQPQVPLWHLLGTSPLHEGQRQSQAQPQAVVSQGQGRGEGYQQQPLRPDWHLMGTSPLHDAYLVSDVGCNASQSRGSTARPLTYASMAVGSWSDKAKQHTSPGGHQIVPPVRLMLL